VPALGITRLGWELIGVLILLAAGLMWLGFHDAKIADDARQVITTKVAAAAAAAAASQAAQDATTLAEQKGNLHDAQEQVQATAVQVADLRSAVAGAYRLRDDAIRRAAAANHPAATASGAAGGDIGTGMVQGGLLGAALDARAAAESDAADLAAYATGLRTSGQLCSRNYDALTDR
jgi:hypothetical protein